MEERIYIYWYYLQILPIVGEIGQAYITSVEGRKKLASSRFARRRQKTFQTYFEDPFGKVKCPGRF